MCSKHLFIRHFTQVQQAKQLKRHKAEIDRQGGVTLATRTAVPHRFWLVSNYKFTILSVNFTIDASVKPAQIKQGN